MKHLRFLLNVATILIFLVLALQSCLALPIEVFCLTTGIVILGALAYLAGHELWILVRLETRGKPVSGRVVNVRKNRVGWQRLQVELQVPEGTLKKWTDDTSTTTCDRLERGDVVSVTLSKDWRHCRLHEPSSSFYHMGFIMASLSLGAILATGKMLLLAYLLVTQQACGETCETVHCEDEFQTRMLYAALVGATVYTDLYSIVQQRYFDSFPSLTDIDIQQRNDALEADTNADVELGTDEMTALTGMASKEPTGDMEMV